MIMNPQKSDNDNICLHLWELWMPHLKYLSTVVCGRQKRDNTNAVKILHQMSVWVVALGLVLNNRLSIIYSKRLKKTVTVITT